MAASLDDILTQLVALPQRLAMAMGHSGAGPSPSGGGPGQAKGGGLWPKVETAGGALGRFVPGISELTGFSRDIRAAGEAIHSLFAHFQAPPTQIAQAMPGTGGVPQTGFPAALAGTSTVYPKGATSPLPSAMPLPQGGFPATLAATNLPTRLPALNPQVTAPPSLPAAPQTGLGTSTIAQSGFPVPLASTTATTNQWPGTGQTTPLPATQVASWPKTTAAAVGTAAVTGTYPVGSPASSVGQTATPGAGSGLPPNILQSLQDLVRAIQDNTRAQKESGGDDTENEEVNPPTVTREGLGGRVTAMVAQKTGMPPAALAALRQLANRGQGVPQGGYRPSQAMPGSTPAGGGSGVGAFLVGLLETLLPFLV